MTAKVTIEAEGKPTKVQTDEAGFKTEKIVPPGTKETVFVHEEMVTTISEGPAPVKGAGGHPAPHPDTLVKGFGARDAARDHARSNPPEQGSAAMTTKITIEPPKGVAVRVTLSQANGATHEVDLPAGAKKELQLEPGQRIKLAEIGDAPTAAAPKGDSGLDSSGK